MSDVATRYVLFGQPASTTNLFPPITLPKPTTTTTTTTTTPPPPPPTTTTTTTTTTPPPTTTTTTTTTPPTTTTTTTPTPTGCGGEVPAAKPGGGSWACSFDDEFDASTGDASSLNRAVWTPQQTATSGFTTGQSPYYVCYEDSPNNISVSGGALHLTVRKETTAVNCGAGPNYITGGMVSSAYSFSQTYGRFEVRAQLPAATVAGLQETLWLWPVNSTLYGSWPASGEVDFSEFYSQYYNLDVPYIHYDYSTSNPATNTNTVTAYNCQISVGQYNTYAVVWTPGKFTITVNGTNCLTDNYVPSNVASPAPFNQPFFIALTQALGEGTNAFNPSSTPLPATTSVDYVRVWK